MARRQSPTPHGSTSGNSSDRRRGTIVRRVVERSFGFVRDEVTGEEFFFHSSDLENVEFAALAEGKAVSFLATATPKGPRAGQVRIV